MGRKVGDWGGGPGTWRLNGQKGWQGVAGAAEGCKRLGSEARVGAGQARGPDGGDLQVTDSQTNARCSTKNNQICNFCAKSDSIFSWIPGRAGELYQVPEI